MTASKASTLILWKIMSRKMPALLTTPSSRPKWSVAVLTILLAGIASATDSKLGTAMPPRFLISSTTSSPRQADEPAPSAAPPPPPAGRGGGAGAVGRAAGIVDHDLGAFGCAEQRDLTPDAAACAGDD